MCGAKLENIVEGSAICTCEYCGTTQTLPRIGTERYNALFDRANYYRAKGDFDSALAVYQNILAEAPDEPEAHWGLCLCRYGIGYVVDPRTSKRVPTCNRAQFSSILEDADYIAALENSDTAAREVYEAEAGYINKVQKRILEISSHEQPFDIFICYKETDDKGERTPDSVIAQDIYEALTKEGYKVFFSRITLEDKLGQEYEPYIFAALNSAKIMLIIGTKPDYFNAVWVKNEWSRFLSLMEHDTKKALIPCYRDMSPYDMPERFISLQSQDISKVGYMQDLIRGIKKITGSISATAERSKAAENPTTENYLKRGMLSLGSGKWDEADRFFEKALNIDAENYRAYIGKLMAECRINSEAALLNAPVDLRNHDNFKNAVRFAPESEAQKLKKAGVSNAYKLAVSITAHDPEKSEAYYTAADIMKSLGGYSDSGAKADEYRAKGDTIRENMILAENQNRYNAAAAAGRAALTTKDMRNAAAMFRELGGFFDSAEQARSYEELADKTDKRAAAISVRSDFMHGVRVVIRFLLLVASLVLPYFLVHRQAVLLDMLEEFRGDLHSNAEFFSGAWKAIIITGVGFFLSHYCSCALDVKLLKIIRILANIIIGAFSLIFVLTIHIGTNEPKYTFILIVVMLAGGVIGHIAGKYVADNE